jgi:hypothetical protein
MEPRAWYNFLEEERSAFEEKGCIFGASGENYFLLTLRGRSNQDQIVKTTEMIRNGQPLSTFESDDLVLMPIDAAKRIEVRDAGATVVIKSRLDNRKDMRWSISKDQLGGETIACEIAEISGRRFQESQEELGFGAAISGPTMLGLFAVLLTIVLFTVSYSIDAGEAVSVQGRYGAVGRLVVAVAGTLGVKGSVIVGIFAIAAALAYGVYNTIKRPQFKVFEFTQGNGILADNRS